MEANINNNIKLKTNKKAKIKLNLVNNNYFMKTLFINDCYGVTDKIRYNLTEGWKLSKRFIILCDSDESFNGLRQALEDVFINGLIYSNDDNENSGIGINNVIFSGMLDEEDKTYLPALKKVKDKGDYIVYKFYKQSIIISKTLDIFNNFIGNKPNEEDIGFFFYNLVSTVMDTATGEEKIHDYALDLKSHSTWIKKIKEKHKGKVPYEMLTNYCKNILVQGMDGDLNG